MRLSTLAVLYSSADDSDVYKELTIDGLLGAVLRIPIQGHPEGHLWRVLRYVPAPDDKDRGHLVCCQVLNEHSRVNLHWPTVRTMIYDGSIIVE